MSQTVSTRTFTPKSVCIVPVAVLLGLHEACFLAPKLSDTRFLPPSILSIWRGWRGVVLLLRACSSTFIIALAVSMYLGGPPRIEISKTVKTPMVALLVNSEHHLNEQALTRGKIPTRCCKNTVRKEASISSCCPPTLPESSMSACCHGTCKTL